MKNEYENMTFEEMDKEKIILLGRIRSIFNSIGIVPENAMQKLIHELILFEEAYDKKKKNIIHISFIE